ncbi:stage V sporulation protein B [Clostridium sp. MT-14]|uniref:Multidrug-efflux transporter n=1 Tax=Clostridium aromativorans TaxID=2836848 RepID=A0ABS8NCR2_9CLOT|nr:MULTISPECIES: stage V sporulation protein B [Clostridium]KAA8672696.1 stage V sporulation protein B [Clostridium sp. HV4-5-A1G]MCC9296508.1 stage V sporulation protein B [Clostridium aromativorans]CAB1245501.1 Stage V sporulation protein B [Clostridiaceae bacterium BL-3]
MKRERFLKSTLILICSNLITSIFAFVFSIILSRNLGAEGMGLYGLIMPVYDLFICLITGGMVTAISRVAAVYFGRDDFNNLNRSIDISLTFNSLLATFVVCMIFINAPYISANIIKDTRSIHALQVMCPAIFFIALSSILKGYFYGISEMKIPAFIDISEKFLRIVIITLLINSFSLKDVNGTVTAAYITLTLGEFISFTVLYVMYKIKKRRFGFNFSNTEDKLQLLFNILVISFPLCINGFLSTSLSAISALIVPRRLVASGIEYNAALGMIGRFNGMAMNIIFFPTTIITSMSIVLIPDLSEKMSKKDYWAIERRISQIVKIALFLGVLTMIICISLSDYLGELFYRRYDLEDYIKFTALSAPIIFVSMSTFGILNGIGKQKVILRNSLISSVMDVILVYFLTGIPSINVYGCGISLMITSLTTLALNMHELIKDNFYGSP